MKQPLNRTGVDLSLTILTGSIAHPESASDNPPARHRMGACCIGQPRNTNESYAAGRYDPLRGERRLIAVTCSGFQEQELQLPGFTTGLSACPCVVYADAVNAPQLPSPRRQQPYCCRSRDGCRREGVATRQRPSQGRGHQPAQASADEDSNDLASCDAMSRAVPDAVLQLSAALRG